MSDVAFKLVKTPAGGTTMVRKDKPSLLLYAANVRTFTRCDPLAASYYATVAGAFTAGVPHTQCAAILDGMLANEIEYLDGLMEGRRAARRAPTGCVECGLPESEHHYNGACYGKCGKFVAPEKED